AGVNSDRSTLSGSPDSEDSGDSEAAWPLPPQPDTNTAATAAAVHTDDRHTPLLVLTITHNPQPRHGSQTNLRANNNFAPGVAKQSAERRNAIYSIGTQRFNTPRMNLAHPDSPASTSGEKSAQRQ